ncbi:MAG TPA: PAS domain-containing protein [Candidatus Methylomirabilis sp.]|nr:PAS domain-containing protein [Candidatus Methylomirabilis sp.]HSB82841.1 PAS domain-containing protein [Candidatus Methylomirabilis sp.]
MIPRPHDPPEVRQLDRLRWLGIWLPAAALLIVAAEGVVASLELPWGVWLGTLGLLLALLAAGAYGLATYLLGIVRRQEAYFLRRQQELLQTHTTLQASLAEQERAAAALRESQAQLAGSLGSARDAILTIEETQRIVLFNAAAERLFRVPAAEALGQPVARFIPERFQETHRAGLHGFGRTNL